VILGVYGPWHESDLINTVDACSYIYAQLIRFGSLRHNVNMQCLVLHLKKLHRMCTGNKCVKLVFFVIGLCFYLFDKKRKEKKEKIGVAEIIMLWIHD